MLVFICSFVGQSCGSNGLACASGICTSPSRKYRFLCFSPESPLTSIPVQCQMIGGSMNLSQACPNHDTSCQVSCQDPNSPNQCRTLSALLVDGSPCGKSTSTVLTIIPLVSSGFTDIDDGRIRRYLHWWEMPAWKLIGHYKGKVHFSFYRTRWGIKDYVKC